MFAAIMGQNEENSDSLSQSARTFLYACIHCGSEARVKYSDAKSERECQACGKSSIVPNPPVKIGLGRSNPEPVQRSSAHVEDLDADTINRRDVQSQTSPQQDGDVTQPEGTQAEPATTAKPEKLSNARAIAGLPVGVLLAITGYLLVSNLQFLTAEVGDLALKNEGISLSAEQIEDRIKILLRRVDASKRTLVNIREIEITMVDPGLSTLNNLRVEMEKRIVEHQSEIEADKKIVLQILKELCRDDKNASASVEGAFEEALEEAESNSSFITKKTLEALLGYLNDSNFDETALDSKFDQIWVEMIALK